jgi:broad specificity phosphatase PhoE
VTIYLARHGQTSYNATRRFQGQTDVPLDETGRRQARELAERVAGLGLVALWASPLARARQTAEAVSVHTGLSIRYDERLMETDTGVWTNRYFDELDAFDPDARTALVTEQLDFRYEGGESFGEQGDRVLAAFEDIARGPRPALVVSHGMAIRLGLARWTGQHVLPAHLENTELRELPPRG